MVMLNLIDSEALIVKQCLIATVNGSFFPDWEFETLIGASKLDIHNLIQEWPEISNDEIEAIQVIKSCLGSLLGYPHGKQDELHKYISASNEEIMNIVKKLQSQ